MLSKAERPFDKLRASGVEWAAAGGSGMRRVGSNCHIPISSAATAALALETVD
ncbi:hypothetical protein GCM10027399_17570 [Curvibacter fontanus]